MTLQFSQKEQRFIVDDIQTDLMLATAGMQLIEQAPAANGFVVVTVSESEREKLISELQEEYVWKS